MDSFKELAVPAFLQDALVKMHFEKPTPIQAQAIPPALEGKDLIASAETGSGKTAAFGIPLLTFLTNNPSQSALILTPTRELAEQVAQVLQQLSGGKYDLRAALLIGGVGMDRQIEAIRGGARLFIGTPGRINDLIGQQALNLSRTGFLVLDEADRMLDMGFAPQLDRMRAWLTAPRQTMLFSATIPPDIERMASQYLKDPVRITVGTVSKPVDRIRQKLLKTTPQRKYDDLVAELNRRKGIVLVFGRTQNGVGQLAQRLQHQGFDVTPIHGGMNQEQRHAALEAFKSGAVRVLVATDVAARGLDVQNIGHVINYELPYEPEDYIHRIGRTGRAGAEGDAITLLVPEDQELWDAILAKLGPAQAAIQVVTAQGPRSGGNAPRAQQPSPAPVPQPAPPPRSEHGRGGRDGRRGDRGRQDDRGAQGSDGRRDRSGRYGRGERRDRYEREERTQTTPKESWWSRLVGGLKGRRDKGPRDREERQGRRDRQEWREGRGGRREDRGRYDRERRSGRQDRQERYDRGGRNDRYDRNDRYGERREVGGWTRFKWWLRDQWNK